MPLEPSLMKELQFYEQKAKEMAEVCLKVLYSATTPPTHTHRFSFSFTFYVQFSNSIKIL